MHLNIYLPDSIAREFIQQAENNHLNKSAAIREAVEAWVQKHKQPQWPTDFFNFEGIKEAPDFTEYRKDLTEPKELF